MNTIMAYLENMFHGLPKTAEVFRIKQDLLSGMEEKYCELKSQGKTENEAVGIVIAEFGNIEELKVELGLSSQPTKQDVPELSDVEVYDYMELKRVSGKWIGIGVFLILLGVAFMISSDTFFETVMFGNYEDLGVVIGLVGMFALIAVAVTIFILQGMKLQRFEFMEKKGFKLSYSMKSEVMARQANFASTYRASVIIGVCILILSPILIFSNILLAEKFATLTVSLFLLIIASAIYIFVYYGGIQTTYTTLLEEQEYEDEKQTSDKKLTSAISSIMWTLATAVYLFISFVYDSWHISWVVFAVTGVLSSMIGSIVTLIKAKQ